MILCVLRHNNHHRMKWYRLDEFAIADHVEKYPIDLWQWGIQNRSGHLQTRDLDIVRSNLLPSGEASVTEKGIYFKGVWYTCERAIHEQWYVRARQQGRQKKQVVYDPRKTDIIYLVRDRDQKPEPCVLLDRDKPTYEGLDWQEVEDYFELQKQAEEASRTRELRAEAEFHAQAEHTMREAEEMTREAVQGLSKSAHLGDIRENRKDERDDERQGKAHAFAPVATAERQEATSARASKERQKPGNKGYVPPAQPINDIRQRREAKLRNSQKELTNGQ